MYVRHKSDQVINQLNTELMQANLELGKAHTKFGDANKYIGELEGKLQKEIKAKNEILTMYGKLLAEYNAKGGGIVEVEPGAVEVIEVPVESTLEFLPHHFYWAETKKTMRDLGLVMGPAVYQDHRLFITCLASNSEEEGLVFGLDYQLTLKLAGELAQTTTESGAINNYLTLWELNKEGKKIGKFELESFEVVVTNPQKSEFFWLAPHLDLGATVGFDGTPILGGSVGISLSGYGNTKNDLSWRFFRIGMTLAEQPRLELSPALWNLGGPLPLVSNIWIAPAATYSGKWGGALLFNVVL